MSKNKLQRCKEIREFAAHTLVIALQGLLQKNQPISEVDLRDRWLGELKKNKSLLPFGWYVPPPFGISVLFATESDSSRVNPLSLRPKEFWPKKDVFLDKSRGYALLYASPIDKRTGVIGDFGVTLYFGKNKKVQNHFRNCFKIHQQIFRQVKIGMKFSVLNTFANKLFNKENLMLHNLSMTDKTQTNIGHTIPVSYEKWKTAELAILKRKKIVDIASMISQKRVFISSAESFQIKKNLAFTIEPRLCMVNNRTIPAPCIHTIAFIKDDGTKELLTSFGDIYKLAGMDYMPSHI